MTRRIAAVAALLVMGTIWACSDDGNPAATSEGAVCAAPADTLTGAWDVMETIDESGCGGGTSFDNYVATVSQNGNDLEVTAQGGTFSGTICGPIVRWTGSFPDPDGGTVMVTDLTLTLGAGGNTLSGQASWVWSDGVDSCSGTTQADLTRL